MDDQDSERSDVLRAHKYPPLPSLEELGLIDHAASGKRLSGVDLPRMGKFRFQLLAQWISQQFPPCRVADVGGGKGLLSYFLNRAGFEATVIDPIDQALPTKFKDLDTEKRVRLPEGQRVSRLSLPFDASMTRNFDLVVALHAHGSNIKIIESCLEYGRSFVLLPCCVIDEPIAPPLGTNWFVWLSSLAKQRGMDVRYFQLNFKGQNLGMYSRGSALTTRTY